MEPFDQKDYLEKLKKRGKDKRVTRSFQFIGLEIATTLRDLKHKALYIKLAKQHDPDKLLRLAKDVADRRDVQNPGAYFMRVLSTDYEKIRKYEKDPKKEN
ncbi:MAG: hypothetical protein COU11_03745 [Candidatus Harrisonbacteria bacterium CG10_big_fil_rev_8_21_14_0_10_49_15]|uniref:Uncharacterized protein n=1 Tax=Candidatus Harrisonbacteria bacterium CG10_big_fil_rev_8_21_14_0_10_49_15 TaxID=1974587 RepID=A0A2H0UK67_9BACT|nr:MAG: hypothetical protein COU11_03745 [Candidatus Harrisonbacteria bacterium CG10_big_fil_rev_8_21_14_0_10_49_15]